MNNMNIAVVVFGGLITGFIGLGFWVLRVAFIRAAKSVDDALKETKDAVVEIKNHIHRFELEAAVNYAKRSDVDKVERDNHASHGTIHARIDDIKERVAKLEAVMGRTN